MLSQRRRMLELEKIEWKHIYPTIHIIGTKTHLITTQNQYVFLWFPECLL